MNSVFSKAGRLPDPFGMLSLLPSPDAAFAVGWEPAPLAWSEAIAEMQRKQLDAFGLMLRLWMLPLAIFHDGPSGEAEVALPAVAQASPATAEAAPAVLPLPAIEAETPALHSAPEGVPDDLERIVGIGPKLRQTLHNLGIRHFRQIAALTPDEVLQLNEKIGFKGRIEREGWQAQASRLSKAARPPQAA